MRIAEIVTPSYVDGPGARTVVRVQGCSIHCPGCQNQCLWPADGGMEFDEGILAGLLADSSLPVTITGGEPFDQPEALARLLALIRMRRNPADDVIVYTGRTFEELVHSNNCTILAALAQVDVLVDGPHIQALDHDGMQYRGSSNQRVIDMRATFRQPARVTLSRGPVLLDWDTPEVVITGGGDVLAAADVAREFADLGVLQDAPRCGEVGGVERVDGMTQEQVRWNIYEFGADAKRYAIKRDRARKPHTRQRWQKRLDEALYYRDNNKDRLQRFAGQEASLTVLD